MGVKCPAVSFIRPNDTTQYATGDLVANSTSAGSVAALQLNWGGLNGSLARIRLSTSNATITNGNFYMWLFATNPSGNTTNGDNGAIAGLSFTTYNLLTVAPINLTASMGSTGGWGEATYDRELIQVPVLVYALIEARAGYTPAAQEVITVQADIWP